MPADLLIALTIFSCVMAFTPGPNNILLAASGVNFGFTHTIPHMLGVTIGFGLLLIACAAGLGILFTAVPKLHLVLKVGGALYMLWLSWKVATAHTNDESRGPARPFTFFQAAAFQWVNPKAVIAALSAITLYVRPGQFGRDFPVMLAILTICTVGSVATWTGFGVALRRLLRNPVYARVFNVSMALLLLASIVPMVS
jgi:threonine/homoserine/homoserine lactone efflux protein